MGVYCGDFSLEILSTICWTVATNRATASRDEGRPRGSYGASNAADKSVLASSNRPMLTLVCQAVREAKCQRPDRGG